MTSKQVYFKNKLTVKGEKIGFNPKEKGELVDMKVKYRFCNTDVSIVEFLNK